jgi:hypothetical protein
MPGGAGPPDRPARVPPPPPTPLPWSARGALDPVALDAGDSLSGDVAIVKNLGLIEPHRIMHECRVLRFSYRGDTYVTV